MRKWLIGVWLLLVPAVLLWHYGPGQAYLRADDASESLRAARKAAEAGDWEAAIAAYDEALHQIPEDRVNEIHQVQLARAIAKLRGKTLAKGREELAELVEALEKEPERDPQTLSSARSALAYAQYHTSWLMRLEGRSRIEWEPELESARQLFRVSAEQALARDDRAAATRSREDLESAVRMARMDLNELQARNLPEELEGSGSDDGEQEGKGKGKGKKGKGKGKGEEGLGEGSGLAKDARGASAGPPPDKGGH